MDIYDCENDFEYKTKESLKSDWKTVFCILKFAFCIRNHKIDVFDMKSKELIETFKKNDFSIDISNLLVPNEKDEEEENNEKKQNKETIDKRVRSLTESK